MKNILSFIAILTIFLCFASTAVAVSFDATLTADNHYALYYGNEIDGINLVGRNETGTSGDPGLYNWTEPENWTFNVAADNFSKSMSRVFWPGFFCCQNA